VSFPELARQCESPLNSDRSEDIIGCSIERVDGHHYDFAGRRRRKAAQFAQLVFLNSSKFQCYSLDVFLLQTEFKSSRLEFCFLQTPENLVKGGTLSTAHMYYISMAI
jgi:hypothetical protein